MEGRGFFCFNKCHAEECRSPNHHHFSKIRGFIEKGLAGGGAPNTPPKQPKKPWWTFRIFFIFCSARGGGRGSLRSREGGRDPFLIENPRRGGGHQDGRGRGAGRASAVNWGIRGGGGKIFFFGAEMSTEKLSRNVSPLS